MRWRRILREAYADLERKVAERTRELTIANEKLGEASEHKSQFLANVNHELRTPVSAIIGYANLLAAPNPRPDFAVADGKSSRSA